MALSIVGGDVHLKGAHFHRVFADDTREQAIIYEWRRRLWGRVINDRFGVIRRPSTSSHPQEQEGEHANQGTDGHGLARGEFHDEGKEVIDNRPLHRTHPYCQLSSLPDDMPLPLLRPRHQPGLRYGSTARRETGESPMAPSYLITAGISTSVPHGATFHRSRGMK
jgi:hypothetical protein